MTTQHTDRINVRATPEEVTMLEFLVQDSGMTGSAIVRRLIRLEYERRKRELRAVGL